MERPLVEVTQGAKTMADGIWQCLGVFADHSQICFLYAGLYAARIEFHLNSMPPIELPRLTGSLRAFSGVSYPHSRPPENVNDLLKRKRQLRARKQLAKTLSWVELKNLISESASSDKVAAQEVCISLLTDKKKVFLSSLFSQIQKQCIHGTFYFYPHSRLPLVRMTGIRTFKFLSAPFEK